LIVASFKLIIHLRIFMFFIV